VQFEKESFLPSVFERQFQFQLTGQLSLFPPVESTFALRENQDHYSSFGSIMQETGLFWGCPLLQTGKIYLDPKVFHEIGSTLG